MAERQGQTAARNMLGAARAFDAVPFFWSQHYDVSINYVGHAERWDELAIEGDLAARDCLVQYKRDGRVWQSPRSFGTLQACRLKWRWREKRLSEPALPLGRSSEAGFAHCNPP